MYVQFGKVSLKICNHTLGEVSGSIYADQTYMTHTGQKPTKMAWTNNLKEIRTCIGFTVHQEINDDNKTV